MTAPRSLPIMLLALITLVSVGCNRPYAERDALYAQATELQNENDRLRMALDDVARLNERNAFLESEVARLEQENASLRNRPAPRPVANQPADTGFENIRDISVDRTATRVTVTVASDILFASGKAELKTSAQQTLTQVASVLESDYAGKTIRIEGYTDSDPIRRSGWTDNLQLSMERAAAVHRYLGSRGVDGERMYAAGFGATHLLGSKPASRRVEIVVVLSE